MQHRSLRTYSLTAVILMLATVWLVSPARAQRKLQKLRIGLIPIAALVTFYAGEKLGYFAEAGVALERKISPSSQLNATMMLTGQLELAIANSVDLLQTFSKGFDFVILTGHETGKARPPDSGALFVLKDSGINSVKDLRGKRINTTSLNNIATLVVNVVLENHGVATNSITWVELPFPSMIPTLMNKQIDAGFSVEPFTTILRNNPKAKVIAWPYVETMPYFPIAQVYTSRKWAEANKTTTKKFVAALHRTLAFVKNPANRSKTNQFIVEFTRMKPELVAKMPPLGWNEKLNVADLQKIADLMVQQGIMKKPIKVADFIYETAR